MALFGIEDGPEAGSRAALAAAHQMGKRIAELNRALSSDLEEPLRIGIGIHCGPAIVGEMGYGNTVSVTAVGDSVNTASRLETQTKEFSAGLDLSAFDVQEVTIRGRTAPLAVHVVHAARDLPEQQAKEKSAGRK
jgi:adenylate cyclase